MNYFLVTTKCGHVRRTRFIPITFPICAESGKEAAKLARDYARVKHNHKDAILEVKKVSFELYQNQFIINQNDPYLHVKNK